MSNRALLSLCLVLAAAATSCSSFRAFLYQGRLAYGPRESNGKQSGLWVYCYDVDHTQVRARGSFEDDKPVGPWEFFYPNGVKRFEVEFRNEAYSGPSTAWWPNGTKRSQGSFDAGLETGAWTFWNEEGVKTAEGPFAAGARDGTWRHYAAGGEFQSEIVFERGQARSTRLASVATAPQPVDSTVRVSSGASAVADPEPARDPRPLTAIPPTPVVGVVSAPLTIVQAGEAQSASGIGNVKGYSIRELTHIYETGKAAPAQVGAYGAMDARNPPNQPRNDEEMARRFEDKPLPWTRLVQGDGTALDLSDFRGRSKLLVVVLRGLNGRICEYCIAQTEAIKGRAEEFRKLNCEIVIVYPGPSERLEQFVAAAREYYQVHYGSEQPASTCKLTCDDGFQLVGSLGLRGDLAKPAAFLLDKESVVRFAWVSKDRQDRPSCGKLLEELAKL